MPKGKARTYGQDLMRGEHVVGRQASKGKTFAQTWRDPARMDDVSRKDLAASPKRKRPVAVPGGGGVYSATGAPGGFSADGESIEGACGTSIFDPVLCEIACSWFCPPGGRILDPFAGGSVRGIVAETLGRKYTGIDLSARQIEANREQAAAIGVKPVWIEGDSKDVAALAPAEYDFLFSCPPYFDLEVYSDDPRDLSTMGYEKFLTAYREIITACVGLLKPDRFACFVVGDVRDKRGFYRGFPWATIQAFQDAGMRLYNDAVLVTAVGSLPIRVGKQFESGRKLGKTHQNVFVFVKGDPKKATVAIGPVQCGTIEQTLRDGELAEDSLGAA
ncbi:MAG: hypothetical protein A3E79_08880 [Burkholderiales bacterium RIFCSPHIGHO2_12_FULL_61_11]|nr:MAG: hypothetical protein A3E79_08880 [Burkholderiales bacterium RIFCSPHIGHO2_12_FULL_61_11]